MPAFGLTSRISGLLGKKKEDNASSTSLEFPAGPSLSSTSLPNMEATLHTFQDEEEQFEEEQLEAVMALSSMQMDIDQKKAELGQAQSNLSLLQRSHDLVIRDLHTKEADLASWKRCHAQLEQENKQLQYIAAKLTSERDQSIAENAELRSELTGYKARAGRVVEIEGKAQATETRMEQMKEEEIEGLNKLLQEESDEKTALRLKLAEAKEQLARFTQAQEEPATIAGEKVTPRAILAMKLMTPTRPPNVPPSDVPRAQRFLDSCDPSQLAGKLMDIPLSNDQAKKLAVGIHSNPNWKDGLILHTCAVCNKPKFSTTKQDEMGWTERIDEFPSRRKRTPCCKKPVCSPCFLKGLAQAPAADWHRDIGQRRFIRCPVSSCKKDLNIRSVNEYQRQLIGLGDVNKDRHVNLYRRAEGIRNAFKMTLQDQARRIDAARITKEMHEHLQASGFMKSLFDLSVPGTALQSCRLVEITPPSIEGTISVLLFPEFFKMRQEDCIVCSETYTTVDYGNSVQGWVNTIGVYGGDWIWEVSKFPLSLVQRCGEAHGADICVECVARHLQVQLEEFGRDGCDKLSCPSYNCNRRLTYDEVRMYAEDEVFVKYDHFHLLNELNSKENFRWCLGPYCENGQLYVFDDDDDESLPITCEECGYSMCFKHQIAWHDGMTCQQYDSQQAAEFLDSVDWIAQNSKKCPGCDVRIIKGEACFHMTCSRCQFQFCWVCLADWNRIHPGGRRYDRSAHNDGCWFKERDVMPTQLLGSNIEQAAREMNF